ncbi:hypothetical protein HYQ45_008974 [Verticillium longisporum]|uniref:Uncharacterized protein n=1 Tax=Verticillium longisporum TaxID=100787 RepID=A0A8I2ZJ59_VERLO|nr:hypothetical protein HYQ45_008974 [Verticillium longisporum]
MGTTPRRTAAPSLSDVFLDASLASIVIQDSTWPRFLWKDESGTAPPRPAVLFFDARTHPSEKMSAACGFRYGFGD